MTIKAVGYSVMSSEGGIMDHRVFLYDSELISDELATEMIENPLKRSLYPRSYFDISISKIPFIVNSFEVIKDLNEAILEKDVNLDSSGYIC